MSLRNRLFLLLLSLLAGGCGFYPLYGEQNAGGGELSKVFDGVKVDDVPGDRRMGQLFKQGLEDQLNPGGVVPPRPAYRLKVTLTDSFSAIGISRDSTVSRYNVYLDSNYVLYRTSDDKPITSGSIRHVTSYNNVTNAYFSTYISEQDAIKRGIQELSEVYRERLTAYLNAGAPVQKNVPTTPTQPSNPLPTPWQANPWDTNAVPPPKF